MIVIMAIMMMMMMIIIITHYSKLKYLRTILMNKKQLYDEIITEEINV